MLTGSFLSLQLPRPEAPQSWGELPPAKGERLAVAPGALASRICGAAGWLADRAGRGYLVLYRAIEAAKNISDAARASSVSPQ